MAEAIGTESIEEILRRQREAEERARAEAEKAQAEAEKAQKQAAEAAAEGEKAAQEATANAQAQAEQTANNAVAPSQIEPLGLAPAQAENFAEMSLSLSNPVEPKELEAPDPMHTGVRSRGLPRITQEDKTDAQFMRHVRDSVMDTGLDVVSRNIEPGRYEGKTKAQEQSIYASRLVGHAADLPVKASSGDKTYINYDNIKTKEQGFGLMMVYTDDAAKEKGAVKIAKQLGMNPEAFIAEAENFMDTRYGRPVFSTPHSQTAKIKAYNKGLSSLGLLDVAGNALDITTATQAQLEQAIRMIPDKADHADAVAYFTRLGDALGWTYDKDSLGFMDSADLTQKVYNAEVDRFNQLFTFGYTEQNEAKFLKEMEKLQKRNYNPRVRKQMEAALIKSYEAHTYVEAPPFDEIQAAAQKEEADKGVSFWDSVAAWDEKAYPALVEFWGGVTSVFKGKGEAKKKEPDPILDEPEKKPEEQGQNSSRSPIASGGTISMGGQEMGVSRPIASAGAMPPQNELFDVDAISSPSILGILTDKQPEEESAPAAPQAVQEAQGPIYQAPPAVEPEAEPEQPKRYVRNIPYDPNMTDEQAFSLYMGGGSLDARNLAQIDRFINDPAAMGLVYGMNGPDASRAYAAQGIGVAAPGTGGYAAASGATLPSYNAVDKFSRYGKSIGAAANILDSGSLPEGIRESALLDLMSVEQEIRSRVSDPRNGISIPNGQNMYDYVLSLDEGLANRVAAVSGAQKQVNEIYAENALAEKQAHQTDIENWKAAILAGNGTPEMLAAIAAETDNTYIDISEDEMYWTYKAQLRETGMFFSDGGKFWQGGSAAAQEGNNLRAMGKGGYGEYKSELKAETERVLEEYTMAAARMGMTLEDYLGSAGIDSLDQVIGIAYNNMQAVGNAYANDPEAQQAAYTVAEQTQSVGGFDAAVMGAEHGVKSYGESFFQTSYMMLDAATYAQTVVDLQDQYRAEYGAEAPQMYYNDLMAYIESGALSQESAAELLVNMNSARNIFDVGYEIDPGFLKGLLRTGREELGKDVEALEVIAQSLPENERRWFNGLSGLTYSLTGMGVSTLTGGVGRSALLGSAVGWGMPEFASSFDENRAKGMSPGMAGKMAFASATATTLLNMGGTGSQIDTYFGDTAYAGMKSAFSSKGGIGLVKQMAKHLASQAHQEGMEEVAETFVGYGFDLLDDAALAYDRGENPKLSMMFDSVMRNLYETDVASLGKEVLSSYGMGVAYGGIFSLGGVAKSGLSASRGVKMQRNYASIDTATKMIEGDIPFTDDNVGKVYAQLQKDLQDPKFRRWIDSTQRAAREQNNMLTAAMLGAGTESRKSAVAEAERAADYKEKAAAAKSASEAATSRWIELQQKVKNGDLSLVPMMTTAQQQMGKAQTALREAEGAAGKAEVLATEKTRQWLAACGTFKSQAMGFYANQAKAQRDELARQLAAQYEAEAALEEKQTARRMQTEDALFGSEEADAEEADVNEQESADVELILEEAEDTARRAEDARLADNQEVAAQLDTQSRGAQNKVLDYLMDLLNRANTARNELDDAEAYNALADQYNQLLNRFKRVAPYADAILEMRKIEVPERPTSRLAASIASETEQQTRAFAESEARNQRDIDMMEAAVLGASEAAEVDAVDSDVDIDALMAQIGEVEGRIREARDMGVDEETIAAISAEVEPLRSQIDSEIEKETRRFNSLYEMQMQAAENEADDDFYDALNTAYIQSYARLESMGVDADALAMEQMGMTSAAVPDGAVAASADAITGGKEANSAPEGVSIRKPNTKKGTQKKAAGKPSKYARLTQSLNERRLHTDSELERYRPASTYLAKTPIYVNDAQKSNLLSLTGAKNLSEMNSQYRTRFTTSEAKNAIHLDGGVLSDIDAEGAGILDAASEQPEAEIASVMETIKKLRGDRQAEWKDARELREKKRRADRRRAERVRSITGSTEKQAAPAGTDTDIHMLKGSPSGGSAQAGADKGKAKSPQQIVSKLVDDLGVNGYLNMRRLTNPKTYQRMPNDVKGFYSDQLDSVFVRREDAGRMSYVIHEIGHSLDKRLTLKATPQMISNLPASFAQNYSPAELRGEAMAEFVLKYMIDPAAAENFAGQSFVLNFERELNSNGIAKPIREAREEIQNLRSKNIEGRLASVMGTPADMKGNVFERIASAAEAAPTQLLDETLPLSDIQKFLREKTGKAKLSASIDPRAQARMRQTSRLRSERFFDNAVTDANWRIVAKGLSERVGNLTGDEVSTLKSYLLAKQALSRRAQGKEALDDMVFADRPLTDFVADVERNQRKIADAAEGYYAWWDDVMQNMMVNTGFMNQKAWDLLKSTNPNYIPTFPLTKKDAKKYEGKGTFKIKRANGHTGDIVDPFVSLRGMVDAMVEQVSTNNVALAFDRAYQLYPEAMAEYAVPVGQGRAEAQALSSEDVQKIIAAGGSQQDIMTEVFRKMEEYARFENQGTAVEEDMLRVQHPDGTVTQYKFSDPDVLKAIAGGGNEGVHTLASMAGHLTRFMSRLATSESRMFSIVRNPIRDISNSINYGSWAYSYIDGIPKWVSALVDVLRNTDDVKQYKATGAGGLSVLESSSKKSISEFEESIFGKKAKKLTADKVWALATFQSLSEKLETASRYAEAKYGKEANIRSADAVDVNLATRDVTVDFFGRGNTQMAQDLSAILPFFHASENGVYRTIRMFTDKGERSRLAPRLAKSVANTAIASFGAALLVDKYLDDEEKNDYVEYLSDDMKSTHWYLPNPLYGTDDDAVSNKRLIRIPLPQDPVSYAVHGAVTNFFWKGQVDELAISAGEVLETILGSLNPVSGTIFDPIIDAAYNKTWYGGDLVSRNMTEYNPVSAENQYDEETSPLAIYLGSITGISPIKIEYVAEQYLGAAYKEPKALLTGGPTGLLEMWEKSVTSDPLVSSDLTNRFYEARTMLEEIVNDAEKGKAIYNLGAGLSQDQVNDAVLEAEDILDFEMNDAYKSLKSMYAQIEEINGNEDLTPAQKNVLIRDARREGFAAINEALGRVHEYQEAYCGGSVFSPILKNRKAYSGY